MFRWISSDNIKQWATEVNSVHQLPELIQRLIRSMSAGSSFINVPTGRQIFMKGVDGYVLSKNESHFVPKGVSIWELGTTPDSEAKANRDYKSRTDDPK